MRTENDRKELTAYIETFIVELRDIYPTGSYSRTGICALRENRGRNED